MFHLNIEELSDKCISIKQSAYEIFKYIDHVKNAV